MCSDAFGLINCVYCLPLSSLKESPTPIGQRRLLKRWRHGSSWARAEERSVRRWRRAGLDDVMRGLKGFLWLGYSVKQHDLNACALLLVLCSAIVPQVFPAGDSVEACLRRWSWGPVLCSDSNILCLSWKGRVPRSEKEKPVCRRRCYEEGWLATGNGRGVVGVTFTSSHCRRDRSTPQRINFNLRGHNSEVRMSINSDYNIVRKTLCLKTIFNSPITTFHHNKVSQIQ